ncbi:fimbrial subunit [Escherichia coli DEC14C]|nr:fimbrial subunit [Escherichia coli DEC14C]
MPQLWWITNETDLAYFAVGLLLNGTLKRLFSRLFSAAT